MRRHSLCINCFVPSDLRLIVQEHGQQRAVNLYLAIVADGVRNGSKPGTGPWTS